ncbi:MAG: hypothetical protein ACRDJU_10615 [Actinomycetota bacterium]
MEELTIHPGLEVPAYLALLEQHFIELLDKLERIAVVMERFDNVMNPTFDLAQEAFQAQMEHRPPPGSFGAPAE